MMFTRSFLFLRTRGCSRLPWIIMRAYRWFSSSQEPAAQTRALFVEEQLHERLAVAPFSPSVALAFLIVEYPFYHSRAVAQRLVESIKENASLLSPRDCVVLMLLQLEKNILLSEQSTLAYPFSRDGSWLIHSKHVGSPSLPHNLAHSSTGANSAFQTDTLDSREGSACLERDQHLARLLLAPLDQSLIDCVVQSLTQLDKNSQPSSADGSRFFHPKGLPYTGLSNYTTLHRVQTCAVLLVFLEDIFFDALERTRVRLRTTLAPSCLSQYFRTGGGNTPSIEAEPAALNRLRFAACNAWVWWELYLRLSPHLPLELVRRTQRQCWTAQCDFKAEVFSASSPSQHRSGKPLTTHFLRIVIFFVQHTPLLSLLSVPGVLKPPRVSPSALASEVAWDFLELLVSVAEQTLRVVRESWGWPPVSTSATPATPSSFPSIYEAPNALRFGHITGLTGVTPLDAFLERECFQLLLGLIHHLVLQWAVFSASANSPDANSNHKKESCLDGCKLTSSTPVHRLATAVSNFMGLATSSSLALLVSIRNSEDEKIWIQMTDLVMWMTRYCSGHASNHDSQCLDSECFSRQGLALLAEKLLELKHGLLFASIRHLKALEAARERAKPDKKNERDDGRKSDEGSAGVEAVYKVSHPFLTAFIRAWQEWVGSAANPSMWRREFINKLGRELGRQPHNRLGRPNNTCPEQTPPSNPTAPSCAHGRGVRVELSNKPSPPAKRVVGRPQFHASPPPPSPSCIAVDYAFSSESIILSEILLRACGLASHAQFEVSPIDLLLDMTTLVKLRAESRSDQAPHWATVCPPSPVNKHNSDLRSWVRSDNASRSVTGSWPGGLPESVFLGLLYQCIEHLRCDHSTRCSLAKFAYTPTTSTVHHMPPMNHGLCTPALVTFCAKWSGLVDALYGATWERSKEGVFVSDVLPSGVGRGRSAPAFDENPPCDERSYTNVYPEHYLSLWDHDCFRSFLSLLEASLAYCGLETDVFNKLFDTQLNEAFQEAGITREFFETILSMTTISSMPISSIAQPRDINLLVPCFFCICGVPASHTKRRCSAATPLLTYVQIASFFIWQQAQAALSPRRGDVFEQRGSMQLLFAPQERLSFNATPVNSLVVLAQSKCDERPQITFYLNYLSVEYALHYLIFALSGSFSRLARGCLNASRQNPSRLASCGMRGANRRQTFLDTRARGRGRKRRLGVFFPLERHAGDARDGVHSPQVLLTRACPPFRTCVQEAIIDVTAKLEQRHPMPSQDVLDAVVPFRLCVSSYSDWCIDALWRCLCAVERRFQEAVEEDWQALTSGFRRPYDSSTFEGPSQGKSPRLCYGSSASYRVYIREKLLTPQSECREDGAQSDKDADGVLDRWQELPAQVHALGRWLEFMKHKGFVMLSGLPRSHTEHCCVPYDVQTVKDLMDLHEVGSPDRACTHILTCTQARLLLRTLLQFPEATFLTVPLDFLRALWDSSACLPHATHFAHLKATGLLCAENLDELTIWLHWIGLASCLDNLEEEVCKYVVRYSSSLASSSFVDKGESSHSDIDSFSEFLFTKLRCPSPAELLSLSTVTRAESNLEHLLDSQLRSTKCILNPDKNLTPARANFSLHAIYTFYYVMGSAWCRTEEVIRTVLCGSQTLDNADASARVCLTLNQTWYSDRLDILTSLARKAAEAIRIS